MDTKEKIEIMNAYLQGKQVQMLHDKTWHDMCFEPTWNWENTDYRIKPEVKYRPYKDVDEMIADFDRRFPSPRPKYSMPFIWLEKKFDNDVFILITGFVTDHRKFVLFKNECVCVYDLFKLYKYLDGSPVGMLEEETDENL